MKSIRQIKQVNFVKSYFVNPRMRRNIHTEQNNDIKNFFSEKYEEAPNSSGMESNFEGGWYGDKKQDQGGKKELKENNNKQKDISLNVGDDEFSVIREKNPQINQ
ncbi:hypothetical protein ABK040_015644 [Willaertia magna]